MAKMTMAEMRAEAIRLAQEQIQYSENFENAGQNAKAVAVEVNGQEIWVEYKATVKQWTKTQKSDPYDPFVKEAEWQDELHRREVKAEEAKRNKEKKITKQTKKDE